MRIDLTEAIKRLSAGEVVGVPTETVYGLAASLSKQAAIQQIFSLKGRPANNPLIIHIADTSQLYPFVNNFPEGFEQLSKAFWPGPLTLILPIKPNIIFPIVTANLPTAGFRIPNHPLTKQLIKAIGPLVMPSANLSGRPSATLPEHVEDDFGADFPVLDGGACTKGLESTILAFNEDAWSILRQGSLAPEDFTPILGYSPEVIIAKKGELPQCPGQLFRHYAPKAKLILGDFSKVKEADHFIGFTERKYPEGKKIHLLGSLSNPHEVAGNLYKVLRQLDEENAKTAWVDMDFPSEGLWQTIAERLNKAGSV